MPARRTRRSGPPAPAIIVIIGHHPSEQVCELEEHAPPQALLDRELAHNVVQGGTPRARRGNFTHPVKLLNLIEDMSGGLQSAGEKPGKALISQALYVSSRGGIFADGIRALKRLGL